MQEFVITLFLCGDVMLGRGIDQVLPHSNDPTLHEPYVRSAQGYVALAEEESGEIPAPVGVDYVWGDALAALRRAQPAARIVNLETAVTTSDDYQRRKGIHYRMHPGNVDVLRSVGVDAAVLANNHVLDWGEAGLIESLETLEDAGIPAVGAGQDGEASAAPVTLPLSSQHRLKLFAYASPDSGVPRDWGAGAGRPGVNLLEDYSEKTMRAVIEHIRAHSSEEDVVVFSVHWGDNWGYGVPEHHTRLARALIDRAGVDVVYGHSSHHPKGIEVYEDRLILYGCGDFLNDYEGIGGHDEYRPELTLLYLPEIAAASGRLQRLKLVPMRISRFRLHRADQASARWLRDRLASHSDGVRIELADDGTLLVWPER
jgi:poly-gamma-glutamate synthesis protein (capsule biosynthesis protein)